MNATSLHTKKFKKEKKEEGKSTERNDKGTNSLAHKRNKGCVTLWPCHLHLKVS
jgi:hypothetical protein